MARDLDDSRPAQAIQKHATLARGHGALVAAGRVDVDGVTLTARRGVVVCTGTSPALPPLPGLDSVPHWTNREAVLTGELPASLAVMGGGAVGVELAQAFARFGTRVTVVERGPRLVPTEEPEASDLLRRHLEADGVRVLTGAAISAVEPAGADTPLVPDGAGPGTAAPLPGATRRKPHPGGFDLAAPGGSTRPRRR